MRVASAMILLLCCGVAASSAAVKNDVALADDAAAVKDDAAALLSRLEALERRVSDRDSVTLEGQENLTNRILLKSINDALARLDTPKSSDNGGLLQLQISQNSERIAQMGAEFRVLKAQSTADEETRQNMTRQQMGAEFRDFKAQTTADVHQTLQHMTRQLVQTSQDGAGASTFVRWGSSTCGAGNASSLVYSGVVGGGHQTHTGSAVNYLCLTLSPRLSQQTPPSTHAFLYGAEYETYDSHQNKNPVCAVCRAAFSTTVMIPGTDTCTPGWRLQYSGFLMAGYYKQVASTEYICVDRALDSALRGANNDHGALLYFTKTQCGSLPCAPYVNGKIVTCAVCSK